MKKAIAPSFLVACLAGISLSAQSLPAVHTFATNPTTGHTYLLLKPSNWYDAEAAAVALGGHVVTINDEAEQLWIKSTFQSCGFPIWIGLTSSPGWSWVSGESSSYTNWAWGEPNGFLGGGHVIQDWNGGWGDLPGSFTLAGAFPCTNTPIRGLVELTRPVMQASPTSISLSAGGAQNWTLDASVSLAGSVYFVLGTMSPSARTTIGYTEIPLAPDAYFFFTAENANTGIYSQSFGFLDANGDASASLRVPAGTDPSLAGVDLHHAFVVYHPVTRTVLAASNLTSVRLNP